MADDSGNPDSDKSPKSTAVLQPRPYDARAHFDRLMSSIADTAEGMGRPLGKIALYLTAFYGLVAAAAAAGVPTWLFISLALAPIMGGAWLFYVTRPKRRPAAIAFTAGMAPRYFRTGPYTPIDSAQYDRADRAHEQIRDWLLQAGSLPRYLSSDSGAGKSSLLDAFVKPEFEKLGWRVVVARALTDPEASLRKALDAKASPDQTITELIIRALRPRGKAGRPAGLLIVIDQFEEFFILREIGEAAAGAADRFRSMLEALQTENLDGLRFLISFRKEYQADIERNGLPLLRQAENWREVDNFSQRDAVAFLKASGLDLDEGAALRLVKEAGLLDGSRAKVRPITLNMLGYVLAEGHDGIRRGTDVEKLLRDHVRHALRQSGVRAAAPNLIRGLTALGQKRARRLADLAAEAGLDEAATRAALLTLQSHGLVRPLDDPQEVWEVAHDFIARLLEREVPTETTRRWPFQIGRTQATEDSLRRTAEAEARRTLADIGIYLSKTDVRDELQLECGAQLDQKRLNFAPVYLRLFVDRIVRATFRQNNRIFDITPLAALTGLQSLNLVGTKIEDVAPLTGLTALQSLELTNTKAKDIAPLATLIALQSLSLTGTQVENLTPLEALFGLQTLSVDNTPVENLEPLVSLTALRNLNVSGTRVKNIEPLARLTALESLALAHTQVEDLAPLAALTSLKILLLNMSKCENIAPLANLISLEILHLDDTNIKDFSPLATLTSLAILSLSPTTVERLAPLADLPELHFMGFDFPEATRTAFNNIRHAKGLPPA